jgi:hypothetical protein
MLRTVVSLTRPFWGHQRTSSDVRITSVQPLITDSHRTWRHVGSGQTADIIQNAETDCRFEAISFSITPSILRENVWRRMMMRYAPFTSAPCDKHSEARGTRYWLALYHPGKRVKAGDDDSSIVDYDCTPLINRVFVAGSFCWREIITIA